MDRNLPYFNFQKVTLLISTLIQYCGSKYNNDNNNNNNNNAKPVSIP